jgi:hypothetical protein
MTYEYERADPAALELFDQDTKECTMNCSPGISDPRSAKERKFLCEDCVMVDQWYLQDSRSYVGNCVLWWARGGEGYTSDIDKAHIYTEREARAQHACRDTDIPWRRSDVVPHARRRVDMQDLRRKK